MPAGLITTLLALVAALAIGWIYLFVAMGRRKALVARIDSAVVAGVPVRPVLGPSIRMRAQRQRRSLVLYRIFNLPLDLPLVHVISPVIIFLIGPFLGWVTFQLSSVLLAWEVAALLGILTGLLTIRALFGWEIDRYRNQLLRQLPDTIQLVVSATRAGLPVSESFRAIARDMSSPTKEEFQRVESAMALGETPDEALIALHQRTGVAEYAIFAVTIGVQARSGGRLAETIQNLADTIRERLSVVGRARALASEAKASAFIMGSLPFASGLLMFFLRPDQIHLLFYDPRGQRMLAIGIITLALGIVTMRQLIAAVGRE